LQVFRGTVRWNGWTTIFAQQSYLGYSSVMKSVSN
jgi:hypothetical protein